jgi:2-phosphoglycolate phosphatase
VASGLNERPLLSVGAIVFDLDGTLIDSRKDIVAAVRHTLASHELSAPEDDAVIVSFVGDGARALLARCARLDGGDPRIEALLTTFLDYYTAHACDNTVLMPGARQALTELAGTPLALLTNKPRRTTETVLAALDLTDTFSLIVADGDLPRRKPDPEPLLVIARTLGIHPRELVMVGDASQDIECGRRAGARTVAVAGGMGHPERLLAAGPDVVIATMADLPSAIARFGIQTRA